MEASAIRKRRRAATLLANELMGDVGAMEIGGGMATGEEMEFGGRRESLTLRYKKPRVFRPE